MQLGGAIDAERLAYQEERVSIDTANLKYTITARRAVDHLGEGFTLTPDDWQQTRDLTDPQYKVSRFITGEIVRRLTQPQRIAMSALGLHSLEELTWDHQLEQHYFTLIQDQIIMQRGLGPEHP